MTFGSTLREIRAARNITQRELAALIQMDAAYLSRIENDVPNHTPGPTTIDKMGKALGLKVREVDELYAQAGKVPPDVLKKLLAKPQLFAKIRRA